MNTLNKWTRKIHRWLGLPFALAFIVIVISGIRQGEAFELAGWLTVVAIGSLLGLLLTGMTCSCSIIGAGGGAPGGAVAQRRGRRPTHIFYMRGESWLCRIAPKRIRG